MHQKDVPKIMIVQAIMQVVSFRKVRVVELV
jgi:hypothetical protein